VRLWEAGLVVVLLVAATSMVVLADNEPVRPLSPIPSPERPLPLDTDLFEPLSTWIVHFDVSQPGNLQYVATRCAALNIVMAARITQPGQLGELTELKERAAKLAGMAIEATILAAALASPDLPMGEDDATSIVRANQGLAIPHYAERIQRAVDREANQFADPLIAGDFAVCKELAGQ
jgi:hypothetical protein